MNPAHQWDSVAIKKWWIEVTFAAAPAPKLLAPADRLPALRYLYIKSSNVY
jgi:hypothetical protein